MEEIEPVEKFGAVIGPEDDVVLAEAIAAVVTERIALKP